MQQSKERIWVIWGLIVSGLIFSIIAAFTEIPAGGADNYAHFNISKWAFRHPHLFLDHWGKPVFTILTAPFAQLGLTAVRIFNIIAGLLTAWFCYRLTVHFKLKFSWFAIIITVFTPIYFVMMSSGMTEILFSLFLVVSIFLFFREKYLFSAIMISFLFLVRSEGLAFISLFFIALIIKKKYKIIPFLFIGFLLFSLIGWLFHYHDFWWLINNRPYVTGGPNVYGSGKWYSFFKTMPLYFGVVVPFFLLAGTVVILGKWLKNKATFTSDPFLQVLLILGSFWGYLLVHNYLWWQGISSAGLVRVMAGVSPLVGVMAVFALDSVGYSVTHLKRIYSILLTLPAIYMIWAAGEYFHRSVSRNATTIVLKEATRFLKKPNNQKHKLVVHNPYFAYSTGKDAWNTNEIQYGFSDNNDPGMNFPDSTLFVWDAHFSHNEGNFPLERIMENQDFKLCEFFEPAVPYIVLGGNYYQILIFRKISDSEHDNYDILRNLRQEIIEKGTYYIDEFTFENRFRDQELEERRVAKGKNEQGFALNLDNREFSPAFHIPVDIVEKGAVNKVRVSTDILLHKIDPNQVLMVFSVEDINQVHHYATIDFSKQNLKYNVWDETDFIFFIPQKLKEDSVLKFYIWNIGRNKLLIDNFKVEIFRQINEP